MEQKEWLYGKNLAELELITQAYNEPKFRAKQIAEWLYSKNVLNLELMSSLSKEFRTRLAKDYQIGSLPAADSIHSTDGTVKYIFPTLNNGEIESVYIPGNDRATLCVSSQAGCKMNCGFCMTGRGGFKHQLTVGEILNQIRHIDSISPLTNLVYMGMGEPLDNFNAVMKSFEILTAPWG
ncbi:MAG: radical SAM protein, partial [Rikenellaceae bacterium]